MIIDFGSVIIIRKRMVIFQEQSPQVMHINMNTRNLIDSPPSFFAHIRSPALGCQFFLKVIEWGFPRWSSSAQIQA